MVEVNYGFKFVFKKHNQSNNIRKYLKKSSTTSSQNNDNIILFTLSYKVLETSATWFQCSLSMQAFQNAKQEQKDQQNITKVPSHKSQKQINNKTTYSK